MHKQLHVPDDDKLLSLKEAAAYLHISLWALRDLLAERRLGHIRVGRAIRISFSELDRFVAANTTEALPQSAPGLAPQSI